MIYGMDEERYMYECNMMPTQTANKKKLFSFDFYNFIVCNLCFFFVIVCAH